MIYENDEIIEASITKSRPGQKIGLGLEEKNYKSLSEDDDDKDDNSNDNCSRDSSVFVVTEIGGLFKKHKLPIRAGDVLLEVNGMPVTNKGQFPNGLKDIRTFLKGTWSIRVKVGRNNINNYSDGGETSATEDITQKSYLEFDQQQQQPEDDTSGHRRYETDDSGHRRCETDDDSKASDAPVVAKRRGRRKEKKETLGALIRDARSTTPSDRCRGTRRGKRPARSKVTGSGHSRSTSKREKEIDSSHTRSTVSTEAESCHSSSSSYRTMETRKPVADSDHNRSVNNRKMDTRVSTEVDSSHSRSTRSRKNGHHLLMKMKEERIMSEAEKDKGKPSFVNDSFASHSRSISFVTTETRKSEAAGSAHSRSTSNRMMEPKETQCTIIGVTLELNDGNRVSVNSGTSDATEHKISGVQCTDSGVTLELKDGNRVSVEPEELMKLVSEEHGTFVAVSKRTVKTNIVDRPSLQRSPKCIEQLTTHDSDDDSISKDKPLDVPTLEAPTLQDLRNLLKKKNSTWDDDENTQILPDVRNLLETTTPGDVAIENLMKQNPWVKTSPMSSFEEHGDIDSTRNVAANAQQPPPTRLNILSLRNLLGKRLQTTNPKKWEESSMVSSTFLCMTNLIDPGDLMKIRNFASRPKLNGATVEIVKKTEAMYGYESNRWDVEVIQRKNQSPSDALQDPNRFISVAADNLKHFA